ncbi:MAG: SH3 domain-containing protein [Planctomycetota bacterium]|jgi:hypothetical protein
MKARSRFAVVPCGLAAILATCLLSSAARAQAEAPTSAGTPAVENAYVAVVTHDKAMVLSGPHDSFYPFGRLKADSLVRVLRHQDRWACVQTIGPAFTPLYGYVRYHRDEPGRMRLSADGRQAVAMGEIDVLAPNLNADGNPGASWKPLVTLKADATVTVIETTPTDREIIHKVKLPAAGSGFISTAHLRRATPAEVDQWQAAVGDLAPGELDPGTVREVLARDETPAPIVSPPARTAEGTGQPTVSPVDPLPELTPADVEPAAAGDEWTPEERAASEQAAEAASPAPAAAPSVTESLMASGDWQAALERLEESFAALQAEPIETAEVTPLRELYLELERRSTKRNVSQFAAARAEQLEIWSEIQSRRQELMRLRNRVDDAGNEVSAVRLALEKSGPYVAVGRLAVSSIYDGRQLPRLLRLQDPTSGRTIAYLQPDGDLGLEGLLGQMVGIVGTKEYDGGLRVNLITPERVEPLTPQGSL